MEDGAPDRKGEPSKLSLSPWNCSSPWRSSAAGAALPTRRSRTSSIRSGCHPPDPCQPCRNPRLPASSCRRRPVLTASLVCAWAVALAEAQSLAAISPSRVEQGTRWRVGKKRQRQRWSSLCGDQFPFFLCALRDWRRDYDAAA